MVDKCETTVLGNGGMEFHETLTKRQRGKLSFHRRTQMGARPQIILWGLKPEKNRSYWCRRSANDSELVYAGSVLRRTPIFHFKPAGYGTVQLRRLH